MAENFEGTILLVSHNRYLVNRLATLVWDLRAGRLRVFNGTYREFVSQDEQTTADGMSPIAYRQSQISRADSSWLYELESRL